MNSRIFQKLMKKSRFQVGTYNRTSRLVLCRLPRECRCRRGCQCRQGSRRLDRPPIFMTSSSRVGIKVIKYFFSSSRPASSTPAAGVEEAGVDEVKQLVAAGRGRFQLTGPPV